MSKRANKKKGYIDNAKEVTYIKDIRRCEIAAKAFLRMGRVAHLMIISKHESAYL